jgi:multiple sugar transport system substrate-binding protein
MFMIKTARLSIFALLVAFFALSFSSVAAQDPVTLNLWIFEGEGEFLPQLIERFQAEHPNINIQITDIPENEYVTKIDTALLAGGTPDLAFIYVPRWIKAGHFLPLDDAIESQGINVDDFNIGAMSAGCLRDGHVYCLGTYTGAVLMFYNKDMFDAAGLPYPSATEPMTVDEYEEMVATLTIPNDDPAQQVWGGNMSTTIWWMDPRTLFSEDGRTATGYVDDESTLHTYQVLGEMYEQDTVISEEQAQLIAGVDLLSTGNLATSIIDNVVAVPQLEQTGIRWGVSVPPVEKEGDLPYIAMWSDALGVFSSSAHPEEAQLFVTFLGTEGNRLRVETTGDLPLNMKLAEEIDWAGESEGRQELLAAVQTARPALFIPDFWTVVDPILEGFYGLMVEDGLSVQEAFAETTPLIQEELDAAWETWDSIQPAS